MENFEMRVNREPGWPTLGWVARCPHGRRLIDVHVGDGVEMNDDFIVEAAWDGEFQLGDFDRTDIVAGSGIRVRADKVHFVSPGSTVDRLAVWSGQDMTLVSNAVSGILGFLGAAPDRSYRHYHRDLHSIRLGLREHTRQIPSTAGAIDLIYFDNLVWDGHRLDRLEKPNAQRVLPDYPTYLAFLESTFRRVLGNATSDFRKRPFFPLVTISSGYDSPTVAAIAARHGCRKAITLTNSRKGENDAGDEIGRVLGMEVGRYHREAYRHDSRAEALFFAAEGEGEDVALAAAGPALQGAVLFTGHHAGRIWEKSKPGEAFGPEIVRRDVTGLSMTEYRLRAGFIHCPVPVWGVRNIDQIVRISDSPALECWDTGNDYSRPLCRRIVEDAGVPRDLFGRSKKATAHTFFEKLDFASPETLQKYDAWLSSHRMEWLRRGRFPPSRRRHGLLFRYYRLREWLAVRVMRTVARVPMAWRLQSALIDYRAKVHRDANEPSLYQKYMFHWAMEQAAADFLPERAGPVKAPEAKG